MRHVEENWFQKQWNKFADWAGATQMAVEGIDLGLRFWNSETKRIVYQSPWFRNSSPQIAGDGKSYAMMSDAGELSLWKVESHLRWPWAMALSLSILVTTLLIGRWRTIVCSRCEAAR